MSFQLFLKNPLWTKWPLNQKKVIRQIRKHYSSSKWFYNQAPFFYAHHLVIYHHICCWWKFLKNLDDKNHTILRPYVFWTSSIWDSIVLFSLQQPWNYRQGKEDAQMTFSCPCSACSQFISICVNHSPEPQTFSNLDIRISQFFNVRLWFGSLDEILDHWKMRRKATASRHHHYNFIPFQGPSASSSSKIVF